MIILRAGLAQRLSVAVQVISIVEFGKSDLNSKLGGKDNEFDKDWARS